MDDEYPHSLDYNATIERMEPGIAPVDPMISLASIAISTHAMRTAMDGMRADLMDIRYAINSLGSNNNINGTNMVLEKVSINLEYLSVLADMKRQLETIIQHLAE